LNLRIVPLAVMNMMKYPEQPSYSGN